MSKPPFVRRLVIDNFKSIRHAEIEFEPLTYLVGPNGSGKSNVLRALKFVSDALRFTLHNSPSLHGKLTHVPLSGPAARSFGLKIEFEINHRDRGSYSISIGSDTVVLSEEISWVDSSGDEGWYKVHEGDVRKSHPIVPDRAGPGLLLSNLTGVPPFSEAYSAICGMRFYNPIPEAVKGILLSPVMPDLRENGSNVADVLHLMEGSSQGAKLIEYLRALEPRIHGITAFNQALNGVDPRTFLVTERDESGALGRSLAAFEQSDGTLRSIVNLAALFQPSIKMAPINLVGLEEPEAQIHPFAAAVIRDALLDASETRQVIVTSHSAELLDDEGVTAESIRAVAMLNGDTAITPLDPVTVGVLRDRLFTAGELLRDDNLKPMIGETLGRR